MMLQRAMVAFETLKQRSKLVLPLDDIHWLRTSADVEIAAPQI
jgi:hypothetical protein